MSVNKFKPHLLVLPEDDANRQIINGVLLVPQLNANAIYVRRSAGGWHKVLKSFVDNEIAEMERYPERFLLLLIDFDQQSDRLTIARAKIPQHLRERVFVLGVFSEPEELKKEQGISYEKIGGHLAKDCPDVAGDLWAHRLLSHNREELEHLMIGVNGFLFC